MTSHDILGSLKACDEEIEDDFMVEDESSPNYHTGPWTGCSTICGDGVKTREVTCYKRDDDGIINEDDLFYAEIAPGEHANEQLEGDLDQEVVTADFDYSEDRLRMVPDWTEDTPMSRQRNAMANPPDNLDRAPQVGYHQLNIDQQNAVSLLLMKSRAYLRDNSKQFCIALCGLRMNDIAPQLIS